MMPTTVWLAVAFAVGAPGGAIVIILSWLLLPPLVELTVAAAWWKYALAAYLLAPIWAPLLVGASLVSLSTRLGWVDWDRV